MAQRFVLRVLGGFALARLEGGEVALPSRRACALLACVAVDGRPLRADLAERLWPGTDSASARRNLRRELARLRDAGLQATFEADAEHIGLGHAVAADVRAFEAACTSDDASGALALWHGALLQGFALADAPEFDAWLHEQRMRLALRWRHAAALQAERLEQTGDWREALRWHEALRAQDPLQETHYAQAMRLHHRLGERSAALHLYAQCLRVLHDELGTRPTATTEALAQRIRAAQELQPIVARRAPPVPPPLLDVPLVGREAELAALRGSRAPVVLVVGDAGVGKTRLVQEALLAPSTLAVRCEAGAADAALLPLAEALRQALETPARATRVAQLPAAVRHEAARLLPALAPEAGATAVHQVPRERFFDALGDLIDQTAGAGGTLWIDDLHWADEATVDLMAHLAHRRAAEPAQHVRIVCAARAQELQAHAGAAALLRRLQRGGLVQRLELDAFNAEQTLALVRALAGTNGGALFALRLQSSTQGNALHLLETLRFLFDHGELHVADDGTWVTRYDDATADYAELPVPASLAATVIERAERQGPAVRQIVEAAALTRSGFTLALIRSATPLGEWEAIDALEAALRLQLLAEARAAKPGAGGEPGYRFVHELAREALAQALRPERRRLIHERLAHTLAAQGDAADHIAWHLEEAGQAGEALPWRLAAAQESRRLFAWRGEWAHLRLAWAAATAPELRLNIVRQCLDAARRLYDFAAMGEALANFDTLAHAAQDQALQLEALVCRAEVAQLQRRPLPAIEPLRRAMDGGAFLRCPALLPRATVALANLWLASGQVEAAQRLLAAVNAGDADGRRAEGEPGPDGPWGDATIGIEWRAALFSTQANAARMGNDARRAQSLLLEAIALLQASERLEARLQAQNLLAHTQHALGDTAGAIQTLEATLAEAERAQLTVVLRTVLPNLTTLCTADHQLERAEAFLQRGMHALRYVDDPATLAAMQGRLAELRLTRGDLGGCIRAARESIRHYEAHGGGSQDYAPWVMLAQIHWYAGDYAQAGRVFELLSASPAWVDGPAARAIARLKIQVARLPEATRDEAERVAQALWTLRDAPDSAYPAAEADYWRAYALATAGHHAEAESVLRDLPLAELGLLMHPASWLALRLSCHRALGMVDGALRAQAVGELAHAPLLAALELAHALGDERRVATHLNLLTASLGQADTLATGLRQRWRL